METRQKKFVLKADPDLCIDTWEEFMQPEEATFEQFLELYQEKHKQKYGIELIY